MPKKMIALPTVPVAQGPIKFGRSKPAKSSSLRKSINFNDDEQNTSNEPTTASATAAAAADDDETPTVVVRPSLSRSGSTKQRKRPSSSRLSFGIEPTKTETDNVPSASETAALSTPKKTLGKRALENNALRRSSGAGSLPPAVTARFGVFGGDEEHPRYSKEYLEELQSSTPNTPQNLSSLRIIDDADDDDDASDDAAAASNGGETPMDLDPSELADALIVPSQDLVRGQRSPTSTQGLVARTKLSSAAAHVLSEAEIRERKERRARLAQESEFISLSDGDSENNHSDDEPSGGRVTVKFNDSNKAKKASESRLIAEDEDLGEGYDEFVLDGGLALGKTAEREAARRHRQEMAELIRAAEDGSEAESDDSEAERRAAYELAQRRAGMDGLQRLDDDGDDIDGGGVNVIPRMKPLPELDEVLQRMRSLVQGLEDDVTRKRARIADLKREKEQIDADEKRVQEILNQAGAKYQAVSGATGAGAGVGAVGMSAGEAIKLAAQSPLRPLPPGMAAELPVERGLESFGTPTRKANAEEEFA
ncbi:nineteen complex-related protein 2-domain-containing protein [Bombardia bombarda]|uniref:Nineteen complex-related protein 2-domain-containing protein n=1 Tax=Bombardia bombarda TaxID=252184 RepID=A0AA39WZL8_9PEZI|nr:nineteen complex-related protein 2-domain-containing protein [Bombardia bombarda]